MRRNFQHIDRLAIVDVWHSSGMFRDISQKGLSFSHFQQTLSICLDVFEWHSNPQKYVHPNKIDLETITICYRIEPSQKNKFETLTVDMWHRIISS